MKKFILFPIIGLLLTGAICAQDFVTTRPQLKAVVLEEYTGMNCPACPSGHEAAANLVTANPDKTFIINIHTGYYATPSDGQTDFRTSFGNGLAGQTNLEGYPSGTINRHFFPDLSTSGGTALSRADWPAAANQIYEESSYVNLGVETTYDVGTRELEVSVETYYVEGLPFGIESNFIQVALVESNVIDYQAGASNSYNHKHILRHLITDQWGDEIENPVAGDVVFRTYTYIINDEWVPENCDIIAFITESHQEVITAAKVPVIDGLHNGEVDADYARLFVDHALDAGSDGVMSEFDVTLINGLNEVQEFTLTLNHDAPEAWVVTFTVNDIDYSDNTSLSLTADEIKSLKINVTPNSTVGVAHCELVLTSVSYPAETEKIAEIFVVSGVDNLIVNGSGTNSTIESSDYEVYYTNALVEAGCASSGAIPGYTLEQAFIAGALDDVVNLYFNIGATTPVLTVEQTNAITEYIDNGGNLLFAGQDIGWDIMGTQATSGAYTMKLFYQNYLSASFLNDGSSANNSIVSTTDSIYSGIASASLTNIYGGDFDPDELKNFGDAKEVLFYSNGKAAAIKTYKGSAKILYLGFGLEQVSSEDVRNDLMDRTYRWFSGWEGSDVDNISISNLRIYPNPVVDFLRVEGDFSNAEYHIYSITGQLIDANTIEANNLIDMSYLKSGMYIIEILNDNVLSKSKFIKQ